MKKCNIHHPSLSITISVSEFRGIGDGNEIHILITNSDATDLGSEIAAIEEAYRYALNELGLKEDTAVFRRIFASDLANQQEVLAQTALISSASGNNPAAVSIVEQPPLPDRRLALWAYHIGDCSVAAKERVGQSVVVRRGVISHIWSTGYRSSGLNGASASADQTDGVFELYEQQLRHLRATLRDNVLRTWIFVQNVDSNYGGMVSARRKLFERRGLTRDTHFIASTGIEGRCSDRHINVLMDAYAVAGIDRRQIQYLSAEDRLGPTIDYGVTFERGTAIDYRDRRHILISGTASIDPAGNTIHIGDVVAQTQRAVGNVASLLEKGGATLSDLANLIVYIRDHADTKAVTREIEHLIPDTPTVFLRAPVCRQDWLMEIECMAVVSADNPGFSAF